MHAEFNLASTPYYRNGKPRLLCWCLLILLVLAALLQAVQIQKMYKKIYTTERQISTLTATGSPRQTAHSFSDADKNRIDQNLVFATKLLRQDQFLWTRLFNNLETVTPDRVRVVAIKPNSKDQSVNVQAVAAGIKEMNQFITRLIASPAFSRVRLLSNGPVDKEKKNGAQTFILSFKGDF